jgi:hypothetical protein
MYFYSASKILKVIGRNPKHIILVLRAIRGNEVLPNKWDPVCWYLEKDFSGPSFLINIDDLIYYNHRYSRRDIMEYILLASYRNYGNYVTFKKKTLDLLHSPVGEAIINRNKLLKIIDGNIHFYFEETIQRRNTIWH